MKSLAMFWVFASVILLAMIPVLFSCASDDDDDDSSGDDDSAGDDDAAGCTQETLCEYAVDCGYVATYEECIAYPDTIECADMNAQTECSCACLNAGYDACSQESLDCSMACVEANC